MYERQPERREDYPSQSTPQDLQSLSRMKDWEIGEGQPDIRGWNVVDKDDKSIGKIDDLLVDPSTGEALYAVVVHGGLFGIGGEKTIVPLQHMRMDRHNQRLTFLEPTETIKDAPRYDEQNPDFQRHHRYWGLGEAAVGGAAGGLAAGELRGRQAEEDIREAEARARERFQEHRPAEGSERREMREEREEAPSFEDKLKAELAERYGAGRRETEQAGTEPEGKTRIRIIRRAAEEIREAEPGEVVVHKGETVEIPVVEQRPVVTEKLVISPEAAEEEEEETEEEEPRRKTGL